ncbi:type II secretion system GspH family protein [Planctomycetaceae bacterium]|nr:type II secretion system GspH family protein [Planctomycetaceae bacterium]
MKTTISNPKTSVRRRAFTLIELIVVMGIIAVIVSLVTMAVSTFQSNARVAATQTLLKKLDGLIRDRQTGIDHALRSLDDRAGAAVPAYVNSGDRSRANQYFNVNVAGVPAARRIRAFRLMARKRIARQAFPQRFSEVDLDNDGMTDPPFNSVPTSHDPETESAEVLYWFLTESQMFDVTPVGTGDFSAKEVADTDGDGLKEFVDAWGEPLRFYRWPTRLIRPGFDSSVFDSGTWLPNASPQLDRGQFVDQFSGYGDFAYYLIGTLPGYETLARDPDDSLDENCRDSIGDFDTTDLAQFNTNIHTPRTWHVPLTLSAGEDGEIGLFEPNDTANGGHLAFPNTSALGAVQDDISNLTLRAGGN